MPKLKQAVAYARFSSDLQNDKSIDDQIGLCEQIARREGYKIVKVYNDRAKSGADMFERDGLNAMMKAVKAKPRSFDAVIVEGQDRLSRDEEDMAGIFKRFVFNDIELITSEGKATNLSVGLRGIVAALFRKDLGDKVRRHHSGRAREGKFAGALTYGYRLVAGKPGEREIDPTQAKIMLRIFTELAGGRSTGKIAADLTREGVASPSGRDHWNHQSIVGGMVGRRGMIGNQLYIGKLVWNANRTVLHPDTRKRTQQPGHADDLIVTDVPHLRIIPQTLWDQVHGLCDSRAIKFGTRKGVKREYKEHLLSGMLHCGECGGHMRIYQTSHKGGSRVACATAKQHGKCKHRKSYYLSGLETVVLDGMKENLMNPQALIEYTKSYHARWAERRTEISSERDVTEKALNRLTGQIDRYVIALGESDQPVKAVMDRLTKLEAERAALAEKLRGIDSEGNIIALHPAAIDNFASSIEALHDGLSRANMEPAAMAKYRAAFRNVFEKFEIQPTPKRHRYAVTPFARLSAIMGLELFPKVRSTDEMLAEQGVTMSLSADGSCHRFCHIAGLREPNGAEFRPALPIDGPAPPREITDELI
jgi:site-specific DNA recombinase